jgi:hypothetical protein
MADFQLSIDDWNKFEARSRKLEVESLMKFLLASHSLLLPFQSSTGNRQSSIYLL